MVQSQYSLSWDQYQSNVCGGFSSLQQNGEFVDMTLAADGYFVKVHQVLMALVSPYLKDLITSAPCQHPVIFLNNVSSKTLSCLLEYVYTGEVLVPSENLMSFIDTAKALHIKGLENVTSNMEDVSYNVVDNIGESIPGAHMSGLKTLTVPNANKSESIQLPADARKVVVKRHKYSNNPQQNENINIVSVKSLLDSSSMEMMETSAVDNDDFDDDLDTTEHLDQENKDKNADIQTVQTSLQYSVSIRGSLQVILNRYIYNFHSMTQRTGLRRWRCVDYRNSRCKAFIVTKGSVVLNRANLHNHTFHDKKILQKINKKVVFSAIDDVEVYKDAVKELENAAEVELEIQE